MNWLFTGFEPFGELNYNPSWDAAQAAAEHLGAAAELLPVTFDVAAEVGRDAADYDLVVHIGVAENRDAVCLERYAHNWHKGLGDAPLRRIDVDGPAAIECSFDLDALAADLDTPELRWRVSHDAGNFVCNATLYHSLRNLGADRALFVHIPMLSPEGARRVGAQLGAALREREREREGEERERGA